MNIETIINSQITVSMVVGVMVKMLMVLLLVMSVVLLRQASLMDREVKLPVGSKVKLLTWSYFGLMVLLTAIVVLA